MILLFLQCFYSTEINLAFVWNLFENQISRKVWQLQLECLELNTCLSRMSVKEGLQVVLSELERSAFAFRCRTDYEGLRD